MKRPSFQYYPADLRNNANFNRCSWGARGAWFVLLGVLHDSDEYGILRWTLDEIALALGCPIELIRELVDKRVLKGSEKVGDKVSFSADFSQRNAPPISVLLIDNQPAPLWYSSRMVRDEYVRIKRGSHGGKSQQNQNVPRKKNRDDRIAMDGDKVLDKVSFSASSAPSFSPSPTSSSSSSYLSSINQSISADADDDLPAHEEPEPETEPPRLRIVKPGTFAMHPDWQPSDHLDGLLLRAGARYDDEFKRAVLCEFISFRLKDPTQLKSQGDWDHLFVQTAMRATRSAAVPHLRDAPSKSASSKDKNRALNSFDDVDYGYGVNPDGSF